MQAHGGRCANAPPPCPSSLQVGSKELFYTEGGRELKKARLATAHWSLQRAKQRCARAAGRLPRRPAAAARRRRCCCCCCCCCCCESGAVQCPPLRARSSCACCRCPRPPRHPSPARRVAAAKARQEEPELQQQWEEAGSAALDAAKRLGQQSSEIGAERPLAGCAFSPDGQLLASCCERPPAAGRWCCDAGGLLGGAPCAGLPLLRSRCRACCSCAARDLRPQQPLIM
jgi:hypothetical protein